MKSLKSMRTPVDPKEEKRPVKNQITFHVQKRRAIWESKSLRQKKEKEIGIISRKEMKPYARN